MNKPEKKPPAPVDPASLVRKPGQAAFMRDQAKYICTVCRKGYFTKIEVEACFNAHPLKEDDA